jgi:hypothetical protein
MAQLYLCPDSDSMYLDVTQDADSPATAREAAPGAWLHLGRPVSVTRVKTRGES